MTHPMVINAAKAAADLPSLQGPAIGTILTTGEIEMMIEAALSTLLNPTEDVVEAGLAGWVNASPADTFAGRYQRECARLGFTAMITKIREG